MRATTDRARVVGVSVLSLVAVLATGCGGVTEVAPKSGEAAPAAVPDTFNPYAVWAQPVDSSVTPVTTSNGAAVYFKPGPAGQYVLEAVDTKTGDVRWSTAPQQLAPDHDAGSAVDVTTVTEAQHSWVVVTVPSPGTNTVRIDSFDPNKAGPDIAPAASEQFSGATSVPTVLATHGGVAVSGVDDGQQFAFDPATGERRLFRPTLDRRVNGQAMPEALYSSYGGGVVTSWSTGGYTYRSSSGGWASDNETPETADEGSGVLLASDGGYIVSSWTTQFADQELVVLQELLTGRVVASRKVNASTRSQPDQGKLVVSPDSKWVVWGGTAFHAPNGVSAEIPDDVTVRSLFNGVGYGTRSDGSNVAVDVLTGREVGGGKWDVAPVAATPDGAGVFVAGEGVDATVFGASSKVAY